MRTSLRVASRDRDLDGDNEIEETRHHDNEIENVPRVDDVGSEALFAHLVVGGEESECNDLDHHLNREQHSEAVVQVTDEHDHAVVGILYRATDDQSDRTDDDEGHNHRVEDLGHDINILLLLLNSEDALLDLGSRRQLLVERLDVDDAKGSGPLNIGRLRGRDLLILDVLQVEHAHLVDFGRRSHLRLLKVGLLADVATIILLVTSLLLVGLEAHLAVGADGRVLREDEHRAVVDVVTKPGPETVIVSAVMLVVRGLGISEVVLLLLQFLPLLGDNLLDLQVVLHGLESATLLPLNVG